MAGEIKTFDCTGCSGYCYGGYHMAEDKNGYGDWVRKEDHEAALVIARATAIEEAVRLIEARYKHEFTVRTVDDCLATLRAMRR